MGDSNYILRLKAKILGEWNNGRSKADILDRYSIRVSTLESVVRNALKEGLYVRDHELLFPPKREKEPEQSRSPSSKKKCPEARAVERQKNHIVRMRTQRDAQWWADHLPKNSRRCRWPSGELLNDSLNFCERERENADTVPLGLDPLPYCTGHRNKARGKGNRKLDAETNKRNATRFRSELAIL